MIKHVKPLHLVCLRDEDRPNFSLIQVKNGIAMATNATIIISMNLAQTSKLEQDQIDILDGKYIHMDVWAKMVKCDKIEIDDETICVTVKGVRHKFDFSEPEDHVQDDKPEWEERKKRWFNLDNIIHNVKVNGEHAERLVMLRAEDMRTISRCFDNPHLYFSFSPGDLATVVFPGEDMGMFALLAKSDAGGINRSMFE